MMKYLIAIIFVFLLVILLFGSSVFSSFSIFSDLYSSPGFDGKDVLLTQTDFPELLKAGRELISKAEWQEYVNNYDEKKERRLIIPEDINEPVNKNSNQEDIMIMPGMMYFDNAYHEFPKLREENLSNIKKNKSLTNK